MNTEVSPMSPWVSILPPTSMKQLKKESDMLSLIKMLVKVTLESIEIFESTRFIHLDALVGNYGCETHAFNMLSLTQCTELPAECQAVKESCQKITQCIHERQAIKNNKMRVPLDQFYQQIEGMSLISVKMKYLVQSRLLTITKTAIYDEAKYATRDYEALRTTPDNIRKAIKLSIGAPLLNEIVSLAQAQMSMSSIQFMRSRLNELIIAQDGEGQLVRQMLAPENICTYSPYVSVTLSKKIYPKMYSCCYYNTKALLLLLAESGAPLVVKKMTKIEEPPEYHAFHSCHAFGQFQLVTMEEVLATPVIVCTAYFPDHISSEEWLAKVKDYGLGNLILASAAQGSQYVPGESDRFPIPVADAKAEISMQAEVKAKAFECIMMQNSIFDLDHFYCSSFEMINTNIGEKL